MDVMTQIRRLRRIERVMQWIGEYSESLRYRRMADRLYDEVRPYYWN